RTHQVGVPELLRQRLGHRERQLYARRGLKFVPWPQPDALPGSLTCTSTHEPVHARQPPGTQPPGPYWHPNGGTRELTDRQIDRKSPRPKGGGFFISDQISSR